MGKDSGVAEESINSAITFFIGVLVAGLVGLLFLIIYGNLSGNLGFSDETLTTTNETNAWLNQTAYTVTKASDSNFTGGFTITALFNATDGGVGNYNLSIPLANATGTASTGSYVSTDFFLNESNVSVSYTTTHLSRGELDTSSVINNLTSGATQFFTFANVWFILLGVSVLIGIVIGLLVLVMRIRGVATGSGGFTN